MKKIIHIICELCVGMAVILALSTYLEYSGVTITISKKQPPPLIWVSPQGTTEQRL